VVELATIPFVLGKSVAVIKQVPAEVCDTCGEPFLHAEATDAVSLLLDKALASNAEVSVMTYPARRLLPPDSGPVAMAPRPSV
jgi:YgiT-type zinc finger domain-containing protein